MKANRTYFVLSILLLGLVILATGCQSGSKPGGALDETDQLLFEQTAELFEQFETQPDQIWNEDFRLDQMPILLVRQNSRRDMYGYLINHPRGADVVNAQEVNLPSDFDEKYSVYRFDELPYSKEVAESRNFDFNVLITGSMTYVMKYTDEKTDQYTSPSYDFWPFIWRMKHYMTINLGLSGKMLKATDKIRPVIR